ncbi:LuxR family transcriptional regulator [Spiractinospora alimapuensis]|uniref:LuxR C-terminal-related transcriptional regulator n=1 Tax=Spiractinospora alimapuensis TaxID=2820884 RepID=UPI001F19EF10|nr:LuxR C-terminal-related transcriptional regulator [Spiractinospora alimapuensis]QVQ50961.1 LuxR family transcriptional regulator [Spiractinospora alimapuensis]
MFRAHIDEEDGVEQATLVRAPEVSVEPGLPTLDAGEARLLAEIASGVTTDVAARHLELSARTLRRRLRSICDRLDVNTPIEAVVWAARHGYI